MVFREVQPSKVLSIFLTVLGRVTVVRDLQLANVIPSSVIFSGMVTSVNAVLGNAAHPMVVSEFGSMTFARLEQPAKALPAISVTDSGIVTLGSAVHPKRFVVR